MPRWASMLMFFCMMLAVTAGVHYYFWARLVRDPVWPSTWTRIGTGTLIALASAVPLSFLAMRLLGRDVVGVVLWPIYVWMGLMLFLWTGLMLGEIARFGMWAMDALRGMPTDPARRLFMARGVAGIAAAGSGVLGALAVRGALGAVDVKDVEVKLKRLPQKLDGLKIVQWSDVHVGPTIGRAFIDQIVATTNALNPDVIAITGDLIDGSVEQLRDAMAPLATLKAKYGVYFVTGNHEYYVDTDDWMAHLASLGIRVLRNERVSIGDGEHSFDLVGVDDWMARRMGEGQGPDLARALAGRDSSRESILLAHQPKQIVEAAQHGIGLQLSGHTHDGQIWPFKYLVALTQPYMAGLDRHSATTQIYVSRGTGYWGPPMRLGAPAEITHLTLRAT